MQELFQFEERRHLDIFFLVDYIFKYAIKGGVLVKGFLLILSLLAYNNGKWPSGVTSYVLAIDSTRNLIYSGGPSAIHIINPMYAENGVVGSIATPNRVKDLYYD